MLNDRALSSIALLQGYMHNALCIHKERESVSNMHDCAPAHRRVTCPCSNSQCHAYQHMHGE